VGNLPTTYYANGNAPVLRSSSTPIAAQVADSSNVVLILAWTDPSYATQSSTETFTIQIDSAGRNFSKAVSIGVVGEFGYSFTAEQINNIALGFGFAFNVTYNMNVRVISSYANNNEQLISNTLTISVTPYLIPAVVAPPSTGELYLVGNATNGGWSNPVPVPTQVFEQVDSLDYAGVFNLSGGNQYLALPVNGDWSNKYATNDANFQGTGGTFGYNANNNFTGPATSGWYIIWFNFQTGIVTVTPWSGVFPDSLYIVGSSTPGGWTNPVPEPSQQFTQINSSQFQLKLALSGANQYLLLPVNGSWSTKYAVGSTNDTVSGGSFGYYNGTTYNFYNTNFTGPASSGNFVITANFLNWTYTVTQ
jgi:hypothetical protein